MHLQPWTRALALLIGTVLQPGAQAADASLVLDWAVQSSAIIETLPGPRQPRAGVLVDLAVFNALNAIEPRYRGYGPALEPSPQALPEAAVAAAVWGVLGAEPQADHGKLARSYAEALAKLPEGPARGAGIALGQRAAAALLALRAGDSTDRVDGPKPAPAPGVFQPIPGRKGSFKVERQPLAPFAVPNLAAFDPGPPPAPGSEQARREMAQARALGARMSNSRSADQTAAALFWNSAMAQDDLAVVRNAMSAPSLSALDAARVLALMSMTDFDARLLGSQLKLRYQHWRPQTALTSELTPADQREAGWEPLLRSPLDPEYPSGYGLYAGATEVVYNLIAPRDLQRFNSATGQTRNWPTLAAQATEMAASRVWGGVHFSHSVETGRRLGRQIAEAVLATQLQPLAR